MMEPGFEPILSYLKDSTVHFCKFVQMNHIQFVNKWKMIVV